jgi:hypothetical protein
VADAKIVDQKKDITKCSKKFEKSTCKISHNILMQEKNHADCKTVVLGKKKYVQCKLRNGRCITYVS